MGRLSTLVFLRGVTDPDEARREGERQDRIARLGTYNSELARGVVHTSEWDDFMRAEQRWFNDQAWDPRRTGL